ncbi:MAG: apolipoprotein N-acyltransferase [Candidatus Omnitrophica bacterium]|nr:apolipoprotein N-acyltransferase [Candidatus Omnitrophota bacterium]
MKRQQIFSAALSGILLALSFPKFSFGFLAWIALVPLLRSLKTASNAKQGIILGLITGLIYFGLSLHWLIYVSTFGWVFVAFLETSFLLIFCWAAFRFLRLENYLIQALGIALAWMSVEIFRSEMPVFGFGWNLIAYSQSDYLWMIQAANTVGAYGLGFVIAFVNVCLMQIAAEGTRYLSKKSQKVPGTIWFSLRSLVMTGIVLFLLLAHGIYHFHRHPPPGGVARISLIQGNIPQSVKWAPMAKEQILKIYSKLTELASFEEPDLIIWPEAAFPGYFNHDLVSEEILNLAQKADAPLLIGALALEDEDSAYNSAYLINREGKIADRYDKLFLVPFGEYVPLKPILGWLDPIAETLGISDFRAGKSPLIFKLQNGELPFSVLICFEDIFPNLARRLADDGAQFLSVITNDAWFGPTGAPYQHLQASVFRAVEEGMPVVRAANTGVSAFISSKGEVMDRVRDRSGKDIFATGHKTLGIQVSSQPTLYRRGGWLIPYAGILAFVIMLMIFPPSKKQKVTGTF